MPSTNNTVSQPSYGTENRIVEESTAGPATNTHRGSYLGRSVIWLKDATIWAIVPSSLKIRFASYMPASFNKSFDKIVIPSYLNHITDGGKLREFKTRKFYLGDKLRLRVAGYQVPFQASHNNPQYTLHTFFRKVEKNHSVSARFTKVASDRFTKVLINSGALSKSFNHIIQQKRNDNIEKACYGLARKQVKDVKDKKKITKEDKEKIKEEAKKLSIEYRNMTDGSVRKKVDKEISRLEAEMKQEMKQEAVGIVKNIVKADLASRVSKILRDASSDDVLDKLSPIGLLKEKKRINEEIKKVIQFTKSSEYRKTVIKELGNRFVLQTKLGTEKPESLGSLSVSTIHTS